MGKLAGDAFLRARERYEESGDVRYAALAIGKSDGNIPDWAIAACKKYAREVGQMPSRNLRKGRPADTPKSAYEKAYEELIQHVLLRAADNMPFRYAEAVDEVLHRNNIIGSSAEEAWRKDLRRRWNDDLDPPDEYSRDMLAAVNAGDLDPPASEFSRHRRIRANLVMRGRGLLKP